MSLWRHGDLVTTQDGSITVKDPQVGECYHSLMGARREARELYVLASGLAERWQKIQSGCDLQTAQILDVGLGLGYNAIATIGEWWTSQNPGHLLLQSLEMDPDLVALLSSGCAPWQKGWDDVALNAAKSLKTQNSLLWTAQISHPNTFATCTWQITIGDASLIQVKPLADGAFDFIWQDPFSPEKNPQMWTTDWFQKILRGAHADTVLMTYSVARSVRGHLTEAGWTWEKFPSNSGIKRHWLRAKPT
jgi:tRNA U34 5-methylaminomethyl-2-thiouridine-forming methyltransferase MnmC